MIPVAVPSAKLPATTGVILLVTQSMILTFFRLRSSAAAQAWTVWLTHPGGAPFRFASGTLEAGEQQILLEGDLFPLVQGDSLTGQTSTDQQVEVVFGAYR
jgi:hypothetical protein